MPGPPRYGYDLRSENEQRADNAIALLGRFVEIAERQNVLLSSINNHLFELVRRLPANHEAEQAQTLKEDRLF